MTISRGFWLGKYEVTQGEWERTTKTSIRDQAEKGSFSKTLRGEGARYPMYYVSHDEATEFCRKLTDDDRRSGKLSAVWEYTLPTEAQWEYACRAGATARFSFGDDESDLEKHAWYDKNSGIAAHEVGSKRANAWGLSDMHGNEWEWCRDIGRPRSPILDQQLLPGIVQPGHLDAMPPERSA